MIKVKDQGTSVVTRRQGDARVTMGALRRNGVANDRLIVRDSMAIEVSRRSGGGKR